MQARLDVLRAKFLSFDLSRLRLLANEGLISSRYEASLFPPYVPRVGRNYEDLAIAIYGTAQNFDPNWSLAQKYHDAPNMAVDRLWYNWSSESPGAASESFESVDINPYSGGVLPALAGLYAFLERGEGFEDLNEIHERVAVTNYCKFSLRKGARDLNPNRLPKRLFSDDYWGINDELVAMELDVLQPKTIIAIRGRGVLNLKKFGAPVLEVYDPAWLLRPFSEKRLECNGEPERWPGNSKNTASALQSIKKLIDNWTEQTVQRYAHEGVRRRVRKYLFHYFLQWKHVVATSDHRQA